MGNPFPPILTPYTKHKGGTSIFQGGLVLGGRYYYMIPPKKYLGSRSQHQRPPCFVVEGYPPSEFNSFIRTAQTVARRKQR